MEATSLLQSFAIAWRRPVVVSRNEVERGQACGCARPASVRSSHAKETCGSGTSPMQAAPTVKAAPKAPPASAAKAAIERAAAITLPGLSVKRLGHAAGRAPRHRGGLNP